MDDRGRGRLCEPLWTNFLTYGSLRDLALIATHCDPLPRIVVLTLASIAGIGRTYAVATYHRRVTLPMISIVQTFQGWIGALDWGNVPTWTGGAIAAIAAFFAIRSSLANTRTLAILRTQKEKDAADERSIQARGVAIWCERPKNSPTQRRPNVWFSNSTNLPVYEVVVEVHAKDSSGEQDKVIHAGSVAHLPPNSVFTDEGINSILCSTEIRLLGSPSDLSIHPSVVRITFTDASGVRWRRDLVGKLAEVRVTEHGWIKSEELIDPRTGEALPPDYYEADKSMPPWTI